MATQSFAFLIAPHLPEALKGHLSAVLMRKSRLFCRRRTRFWSWRAAPAALLQIRGDRGGPPSPRARRTWEFNDNPTTLTIWADGQKSMVTDGGKTVDVSTFQWPKGSGNSANLVGGFEEFGLGTRVWGAVPQGFECTTTISPSLPSLSVLFASRRSGARSRRIPGHDVRPGASRAKRVLRDRFTGPPPPPARAPRRIEFLSSAEPIQGGLTGADRGLIKITAQTGPSGGFYSHLAAVINL
jgi:hypothetical protein